MSDDEVTTEVPWEEALTPVEIEPHIEHPVALLPEQVPRVARVRARKPKASLVTGPLASEAAEVSGAWISVPGWKSFQHYGKRQTPWVKIQAAWLSDYRFLRLADHQKLALMLIWVLAAKGNRLPADPEWLGWRLGIAAPVDLKGLVEAGFLELHGGRVEDLAGVAVGSVRYAAAPGQGPGPKQEWGFDQRVLVRDQAPHERPIVWPPPEETEDGPSMAERVDAFERRQPI